MDMRYHWLNNLMSICPQVVHIWVTITQHII
jgi:hypothetical protein